MRPDRYIESVVTDEGGILAVGESESGLYVFEYVGGEEEDTFAVEADDLDGMFTLVRAALGHRSSEREKESQ